MPRGKQAIRKGAYDAVNEADAIADITELFKQSPRPRGSLLDFGPYKMRKPNGPIYAHVHIEQAEFCTVVLKHWTSGLARFSDLRKVLEGVLEKVPIKHNCTSDKIFLDFVADKVKLFIYDLRKMAKFPKKHQGACKGLTHQQRSTLNELIARVSTDDSLEDVELLEETSQDIDFPSPLSSDVEVLVAKKKAPPTPVSIEGSPPKKRPRAAAESSEKTVRPRSSSSTILTASGYSLDELKRGQMFFDDDAMDEYILRTSALSACDALADWDAAEAQGSVTKDEKVE